MESPKSTMSSQDRRQHSVATSKDSAYCSKRLREILELHGHV